MDEMKLNLSSKFMTNVIAGIIKRAILKKVGREVDVEFEEIDIQMKDGKIHLRTTVDAEISSDEFMMMLKRMV